ncbi:Ion channel [Ancylostoma caninum]|uniref:Ion channel n=1 Tax=Ancylostoma caninum TaxID=29170 RepID=A0A368H6V4_ANCCA|nr:Ion channel [Ancylostoma caninum]
MDHLRVRSPVEIMTDRFLEQRCCSKSDIRREVAIASIPYIVICISLSLYVVFGALTFSAIDDFMDQDTFATKCFFIFTTLTTIGYGDLTPRNPLSKLFCLLYVGAGVPLLLMALINFGQLFAELFWALITSVTTSVHVDPESRRKIPISVAVAFLVLHSLFGAGIFTYWLNEQPFITAIYFSFVSITTIGFGDVIVSPQNNFDTVILTFYLVSGIVIMTTFINGVVDHVVWIHYLGRGPTSIRKNVVWFGGELMTVQELILLAASSFEVSPRQLRETLRNLDEIIALALNDELRKKSKVFLNNGTFITDGALVNNEESRIKHRLKTASSLSRMSTPYHEKNIAALKVIHCRACTKLQHETIEE